MIRLTLNDLRGQFEDGYRVMTFHMNRDSFGDYADPTTFQAWRAYKLCAKLNGVIDPSTDIYGPDAR